MTAETGLAKVFMPMGSNFGDIDNDGFLDIYLGTGNPSYASLVPSVLLRNKEGKSFVDVSASSGTGELHKGHGVAFADLDDDGDDEIVFEVGGATPGDAHALRLFENPGHGNDWINVKLVGVKSNRAAIGARIAVTVQDAARGMRTIHRMVGSGGSFGASPLQQHVGLGKAAATVDVEIWWPTSNTRQRFVGVAKNQTIEIKEFADRYQPIERVRTRLDKSAAPGQPSRHAMTGVVLDVDASRMRFTVSHDSVPGVMAAMTMPFDVRQAKELDGIAAGSPVEFTLVMESDTAYAEAIRIRRYESMEQDPFTARRLKLLQDLTAGGPRTEALPIGRNVPDFTLIDHDNRPVTLSQFRDKVVAINFVYTNCALPQFCFRIANHFGVLQRRFKERLSKDLVLLTVTFDPARDRPDALAAYARSLNADPQAWRFLTGEVDAVKRVCDLFGVAFFPDEGLMNHSSHTAVIDRRGTLVANLEGNEFTATQLGDLVGTILAR